MDKYCIYGLDPGGVLAEVGAEAGDYILTVDGRPVRDVLDLRFLTARDEFLMEIEKPDGEIWELEIELDEDEELGIIEDDGGLQTKICRNKCVFCFIDQMPPGMRDSLYVKDDDERLSFLTGNYITLTNLQEAELQRIIDYRIMPINVSVHTTNPELRCRMLGNRFAGETLGALERLAAAGIEMNGQIVLVPGYNDGDELRRTLADLAKLCPTMKSLSVVPVGLSKYREGLAELQPVTKEIARETIAIITAVQEQMLKEIGTHFVYPSDELFLTAGLPLPGPDYYDGYPQIENGVGMMTDYRDELTRALAEEVGGGQVDGAERNIGVVTGILAAPFMESCLAQVQAAYPQINAEVLPIVNHFFGSGVTVSGLLTGRDILAQAAAGKYDLLLLPINVVRSGTTLLLDDMTTGELAEKLETKIAVLPNRGIDFLAALTGRMKQIEERGINHGDEIWHQAYERPEHRHRGGKEE